MWQGAAGCSLLETGRKEHLLNCASFYTARKRVMAERLRRWQHLEADRTKQPREGKFPSTSRITPKFLHTLEGTASPVADHCPARAASLLTRDPNTSHICFSTADGEEEGEGSSLSPGNPALRVPAANPLLLPSLVPSCSGEVCVSSCGWVGWDQLREMLWAVPAGSTYPGTTACPCLPGIYERSPGVLCPLHPAVTVREGPRQRHGVQVPQAQAPLLGKKGRVIQESKYEEKLLVPWEISAALAQV